MADIHKIRRELEKELKKDRYDHTLGVMYTASALAMVYDVDLEQALLAGLLHDCAKNRSIPDQLKLAKRHHIELTQSEREMPALIHAKLGAYLAKHSYGVYDDAVLNAIKYHTTGKAEMTTLEKILYISDYIEPGRDRLEILPIIRKIAFSDIDKAVFMVSEATLNFLKKTGRKVDHTTEITYEYYKNVIRTR
ncbi:MAG: bis(5'-nucleosyl)-tetraphosphatase (symmetrical) YqeK [Hespellia sp.]|nr:bis(5'-nucleosyl)-tetraphosphatase (symmetrical) YqeK [Hespellia sp.]